MNERNQWSELLLTWYATYKRDLPWRRTQDPYAIWVSEIMLQQTRVETVKDYYRRFLARFPDVQALATAPEADVLKLWEGLGYYSRARNLQKAAKVIVEQKQGVFPTAYADLLQLPGIGAYTAGAIASIAFGQPVPAIDGNVKRVAARLYGVRENVDSPTVQKTVSELVTAAIPKAHAGAFNQAMMELGATLCSPTSPDCLHCPLQSKCDAFAEGDQESLPIHEKKSPARVMDMGVGILTWQERALLLRRHERLLHGLYVFYLVEGETEPAYLQSEMMDAGLQVMHAGECGEATHVFTHRIWNMKLHHFRLTSAPSEAWLAEHDAVLASAEQITELAMPTAMKAAKQAAFDILLNQKG